MTNGKIDWNEIHRRLDIVNTAIEKGYSPGAEDKKKILKARAELLAKQPEAVLMGESLEVVEFLLAREHYGIESRYIREVCPIKDYTPVPGAPNFVLGLINVRGQILSIVDIKKLFAMPEKGLSDLNKAIIIHGGTMEFGILADSIIGVRRIAVDEIQPSLSMPAGIHEEYLRGVTRERMVVLDAEKLLKDRNMIVHEEVE